MYKYLAVDASNMYWRSVCSCMKTCIEFEEDGFIINVYTAVVRDFLDRINEFKKTYLLDGGTLYLLFDNPRSTLSLRQIIDEEYKSPRMSKYIPEAFWDTMKILKRMLTYYANDIILMQYNFCEADDLVLPLLENISLDKNNRMLFISADLDWARGLGEYSDFFNYKKLYNMQEFKKDFNFEAKRNNIILYKVFRGDASDNIEVGLPHVREELLLKIIENSSISDYRDFREYLQKLQRADFISEEWKSKIKQNEERLLKNFQLISFMPPNVKFDELTFKCEEWIMPLRSFFRILNMPFENRMLLKEDKNFFNQKKYKRVKTY